MTRFLINLRSVVNQLFVFVFVSAIITNRRKKSICRFARSNDQRSPGVITSSIIGNQYSLRCNIISSPPPPPPPHHHGVMLHDAPFPRPILPTSSIYNSLVNDKTGRVSLTAFISVQLCRECRCFFCRWRNARENGGSGGTRAR